MLFLKFVFSEDYIKRWIKDVENKKLSDLPLNIGSFHLKKEGKFYVGIIDYPTAFATYCEAVADREYYQMNEKIPDNPYYLR